ncbi:MAG: ribosomal protein S18-alanine N-acetyltransferase [Pseudohongiella sp.]|nr:ribosomal protein S18-alanine N-acetyltransferase [Pseudohongiella sp.]
MLINSSPETNFFARSMRSSDIDLVVQNEVAAYAHPWSKRIFIDCLRAGYQCWVLANKQQIVAHGVMSVAIGECHLLTLCVQPDFQRQGYGKKLFKLLLDRAEKLEAKVCFLEVRHSNQTAITLYRSMGFVQIGERKNYYPGKEGREDAKIMSCDLPLT